MTPRRSSPGDPPELAPVTPEDIDACARVADHAHAVLARTIGIGPEHSSWEFFRFAMTSRLATPHSRGLLARRGGAVVGSVFVTELPHAGIAGIGPLTVAPEHEGGVGRALLEAAIRSCDGPREIRLTQSPVHPRSLALYVRCGFHLIAPLAVMAMPPSAEAFAGGAAVRAMTARDAGACNELCAGRYGFDRPYEVQRAIDRGTGRVVERGGAIAGYATAIGLGGHAIGQTTDDLLALIGAERASEPRTLLAPLANAALVGGLLEAGARIEWLANGMATAARSITGPYLPSLLL